MTDATAPTRILLVTPDYPPPPGGIQTLVTNLEEGLRQEGCEVKTLHVDPTDYSPTWRDYVPRRIGIKSFYTGRPHRYVYDAVVSRRCRELVRSFDPDVVHSMHIRGWPALAVARQAGVPTVLSAHALELKDRRVTATALEYADTVHTVSEFTKSILERDHDYAPVTVIPPSIDVGSYRQTSKPGQKYEGDILAVSRLVSRKNVDTVVKAWARLPAAVRGERQLLVAGDGPERDRIRSMVGDRDDVQLLGWVSEERKRELLADAAVFVLPAGGSGYNVEGFGIVYIEAQAAGTPTVGSTVGGVPEAVGEGGVLVGSPEDPDAVATEIKNVIQSRDKWEEFWQRTTNRINMFDNKIITNEYVSLYKKICVKKT